jgi:DNA-binding Lrp family transcriptional regulator
MQRERASVIDTTILELKAQNPEATWAQLGEMCGLTREQYRKRYHKLVSDGVKVAEQQDEKEGDLSDFVAIFHDKKTKKDVNWRRLLEVAQINQQVKKDLSDTQTSAEVSIDTDEPIIVTLQGDWHLGHGAVQYDKWARDIETIIGTPGVFMVDLGDSYNNMRSFKTLAAVLSQVLPPDVQAAMFKSIVDELTSKNKLLAKVDGNHDAEFDERIFGEQLQSYLMANMKAPRFPNRGLLTLRVGRESWKLLLYHKSRFRSILNPVHGAIREYQMDYPADVVAGAHDHVPAASILYSNMRAASVGAGFGGESFLIKVGTYQNDTSGFGYRYFHDGGIPVFFSVVFDPATRKKYLFSDLADAVAWRKSLLGRR